LLATWCRELLTHRAAAVAWLALEESDNDPERFMAYLTASLAHALNDDLALSIDEFGSIGTTALATLLNALAAADRDVVLVLDDYHLIRAPAIHAAVAYLLEHLPARVCLALGSRADPPLPLARLRVRGELIELRAANLRFTTDEIQAFLAASNLTLTPGEVEAVGAYVEGWPAGVQLIALALRAVPDQWPAEAGRAPARDLLDCLVGSQAYLFNYLAEDVFESQPAHRKAFLLQTSILDRLCGPLCDAILGIAEQESGVKSAPPSPAPRSPSADSYSQLVLEQLEHANLFLTPLDGQRRWYRYHPLFRAFLRERLGREAPDRVAELQRRASAWHAQQHPFDQPIERARALGEYAAAQPCPLVETLSERELEVLWLMADGASNQAIAGALVISVGTVKSHINHILGKLAARNRTEAVAHARSCGLLAKDS
jgi:LuxR family maltose regulon positive regulatory protein